MQLGALKRVMHVIEENLELHGCVESKKKYQQVKLSLLVRVHPGVKMIVRRLRLTVATGEKHQKEVKITEEESLDVDSSLSSSQQKQCKKE